MTAAITLIVVLALFIYGGSMIHGFALAFLIGIVVGAYSSIYVAGAIAVALGLNKNDLMPPLVQDKPPSLATPQSKPYEVNMSIKEE